MLMRTQSLSTVWRAARTDHNHGGCGYRTCASRRFGQQRGQCMHFRAVWRIRALQECYHQNRPSLSLFLPLVFCTYKAGEFWLDLFQQQRYKACPVFGLIFGYTRSSCHIITQQNSPSLFHALKEDQKERGTITTVVPTAQTQRPSLHCKARSYCQSTIFLLNCTNPLKIYLLFQFDLISR